MPKKNMTPEEKKAWGEKMKALREQKKLDEQIQSVPNPEANLDLGDILKQIEELKQTNALLQAAVLNKQPQGVQVGNKVSGVFEKYITDPAHYPDPRERLFDFFETEPKYRRLGFKDNYELRWEIASMTPYERKDGIQETQPRFVVGLDRIIYDEDTYEPTNGRYVVKEFMFFEDPQTATIIARQNGIDVDEENQKAFLDEIRYIRVRDWLIECFYPALPTKTVKNKKDMVINGKQVQYFEISSPDAQAIPFGQLKTKI